MSRTRSASLAFGLAFALLVGFASLSAQARIGFGGSFGSRGSRTFSMPHYTPTAPRGGSPIGRSMTARPSPGLYGSGYGAGRGLFGSGLGRGFIGGLLGAGLFGLLFGHGLFGGIGGMGSFFGLIVQLAIVIFLVRLAMRWFAARQHGFAQSGFAAGPTPGMGAAAYESGGYGGAADSAPSQPLTLSGEDFNSFEQLLQQIQTAFGAEDLDRLRTMATPEMASYFAEQVAQNARRGLINRIADVRLLKGDLSEAWSEALGDFATVAMRFSLLDWTVERASGKLVEGDASAPQDVSEVWTFHRDPQAGPRGWRLSAIQQA
ncbi:MAG TPA: Tim44 domain-containing protein [Beijerinckiaceae bacterium]|nr:Tim44 domain-containing protein [Beijerinckiaceae bacterium]